MHRIVKVTALSGYRLRLVFDDGSEGEVDLSNELYGEVFEPLKDESFFAQAKADEFGAVCWPNGTDLDPDVLYSNITGAALPGSDRIKKTG